MYLRVNARIMSIKNIFLFTLIALGVFVKLTVNKVALANDISPNRDIKEEEIVSPYKVWIDKLAECESSLNMQALGDGGKSKGVLQFQEDTFWRYNEKYKVLPNLERTEVPNVIFDEATQRQLAEFILREPDGWRNWFNCSRKIGLDKYNNINDR